MGLRSTGTTTEDRLPHPADPGGLTFARFEGPREEAVAIALDLCREVLPRLDPVQIEARASLVHGLSLWTARDRGRVVGFKIGYASGPGSFFSWLGGVRTEFRRCGAATGLMQLQHHDLRAEGFHFVETRTRSDNPSMIVLNLRHGFRIVGCEIDSLQRHVVLQRKALDAGAAA
jgi:Acetyltransferase (GNAT) domain